MKECIIAMQSGTLAQKALKVIRNSGYHGRIVSVDPAVTKRGCSYGIRVSCEDADRILLIIDRKNISHGEVLGFYK